ncbi:MAG: phosphate permease [Candidatus Fischerbacteria bacterium RBG_13_37_8]|uniref:Phosphate transporter n=1 Tax=Candidatus Fischerbacteria bacterium RBG_13_37_8 TaxID=1817863 RepID=A0A1F5V8I1_9BACT|nr:MAG: phosphate permease [Candidatus Fischerbacteria bacterium RBG_13_37_8]
MESGSLISIVYALSVAATFYTAWTIGSNDVANAMATSVGSKALTLRKAVVVAAIFEFSGALLVGSKVTETIRSKIIDVSLFQGKEWHFVLGMLAALLATGIWIQIATMKGLPISTTHAIVGGIFGFGIISVGISGIKWLVILKIVLSWLISPLAGFILAFFVFVFIRRIIIDTKNPINQLKKWAPVFVFICCFIILLSFIYKGLKNLHLDLPLHQALPLCFAVAGAFAVIYGYIIKSRYKSDHRKLTEQYSVMEKLFGYLQIMTACYMAFAHGANDVANAIGPFAGIISVLHNKTIPTQADVPVYILLIGGIGIVIGLLTYGYKVIYTLGQKITELTPSRGFSAEFATASIVLLFSKLSIPISTTHTIVGSVIGVGFARGIAALNMSIIKDIALSWLWTLPFTAVLSIILYELLTLIF